MRHSNPFTIAPFKKGTSMSTQTRKAQAPEEPKQKPVHEVRLTDGITLEIVWPAILACRRNGSTPGPLI